eukprot:scaffold301_cov243-Pinguiococcus_pyrenoidosus.AAC.117
MLWESCQAAISFPRRDAKAQMVDDVAGVGVSGVEVVVLGLRGNLEAAGNALYLDESDQQALRVLHVRSLTSGAYHRGGPLGVAASLTDHLHMLFREAHEAGQSAVAGVSRLHLLAILIESASRAAESKDGISRSFAPVCSFRNRRSRLGRTGQDRAPPHPPSPQTSAAESTKGARLAEAILWSSGGTTPTSQIGASRWQCGHHGAKKFTNVRRSALLMYLTNSGLDSCGTREARRRFRPTHLPRVDAIPLQHVQRGQRVLVQDVSLLAVGPRVGDAHAVVVQVPLLQVSRDVRPPRAQDVCHVHRRVLTGHVQHRDVEIDAQAVLHGVSRVDAHRGLDGRAAEIPHLHRQKHRQKQHHGHAEAAAMSSGLGQVRRQLLVKVQRS